jgi:hypothetical protein
MNHEHVLPFVKAIDGANFHAIHELALDATFDDDVSHFITLRTPRARSAKVESGCTDAIRLAQNAQTHLRD